MRGVELDHVEAASTPIRTAATNWSRTRFMSARVIGAGTWLAGDQRTSPADITGQLPSSSGTSLPSQPTRVEPLPPEWPSWRQIFAFELAWTNSTMRFHAAT